MTFTNRLLFLELTHHTFSGASANAGPHYQKLYARVTHIWGNRKGQPDRSAMKGPRLERTASLITVPPASGKYENSWRGSAPENPLLPLNPYGSALRALFLLVHAMTMSSDPLTCRVMACVYGNQTYTTVRAMFSFSFHWMKVSSPKGSGPHSEVVLYRGNPWLGRGKPLFHSPVPKISLIYELLNEQRIRY